MRLPRRSTAVESQGRRSDVGSTAVEPHLDVTTAIRRFASLHAEFLIGTQGPYDLASEIDRADTIVASCRTHAVALAERGWNSVDTEDLAAAVAVLGGKDGAKESRKEESKQKTNARNLAANAYYDLTLDIIDAARRAYPSTRAADPGVIEARGKFRVDTFPPVETGGNDAAAPEPEGDESAGENGAGEATPGGTTAPATPVA